MKLATRLLLVLSIAPAAQAGGLVPKQVPAEARWVTHVDFEAMQRSKFLATLAEQGADLADEFDLDRLESAFGVDARKDLTGITFFNCEASEREFVVIVAARASADDAWANLVEKSRGPRKIGSRTVHAIGVQLLATSVTAPTGTHRQFVLASSEAGLAAALRVLDGGAPSLADAGAAGITSRPSAGAIVFAAGSTKARGSPFLARSLQLFGEIAALEGEEPQIVGRNAHGLGFELGEERGNLYCSLELDTPAAATATEVAGVLRAALARVSRLGAGTDALPQIERLTAAVRIETRATRVRASFRYDAVGFVTDVMRSEALLGVTKAR